VTPLLVISFLLAMVINVPIGIALAFAATLALVVFPGGIPLIILSQTLYSSIDSVILLAVPFFMLAGNLMKTGGVTRRLVVFANALVGGMAGGLGMVAVVACIFFAGMTGSGPAEAAALGILLIPSMVESNYTRGYAASLLASAGSLGIIIPPSIPMVIYSSLTDVSVGNLFLAGFLPGILIGLILMTFNYMVSSRRGYKGTGKHSLKEIGRALRGAILPLFMPLIIVGGIYGGIFTPTESAAVAVAYAMFVTRFVYRELSFADIWSISLDSATITARVLIMVSAATLFSWLLTVQGVTSAIVEPVIAMNPPPWAVLGFANLTMLVAGMFVDVFSNILILSPLLLRLMEPAGISELHFGIVATVNSDMGNITPPFGLNLFVASGAFKKSYVEVVRAIVPWLAIAIVSLMIITYVPEISLWLPKQLYPGIK